jgi:hypothetical protein
MRGGCNCVLTTQFCSKIVVRFVASHKQNRGRQNMLLMVHGFFGKYAQTELSSEDVIEIKISDEFFYSLVDIALNISAINKDEQSIVNEILSRDSNVLPCEIHSIFHRAIIRRCNSVGILTEDKSNLESIALVIQTAQRYRRDVYFI